MAEVLPGRLLWAPLTSAAPAGFRGDFVRAIDLCRSPAQGPEVPPVGYRVTHYHKKAIGRSFGPFGLDVLLRFCRGLHTLLRSSGRVALGTAPGDVEERTNAAVLLGAYLQLMEGCTVEQIVAAVGAEDASLKFVCSWSRKDRPEPRRNLSVADCWEGLAMGIRMGWLDAACLDTEVSTDLICSRWREWVATYDCCWIIPGFIMVGADPVTTATDPNPATFTAVFPPLHPDDTRSLQDSVSCVGEMSPVSEYSVPLEKRLDPTEPLGRPSPPKSEVDSVATVCKEYNIALGTLAKDKEKGAFDFVTFLRNAGVSTIVRTNYANEPGMPKSGGYVSAKFKAHGMAHHDIFILDTHGGLPKRSDVGKALHVCPSGKPSGGAVYVHCKGGFGRSIMLACCLAIDRLDVSGSALLGWVRMVRPGTVNTPQQELLLQSFRGRRDVRRFAGLRTQDGPSELCASASLSGRPSDAASPKQCCAMQ